MSDKEDNAKLVNAVNNLHERLKQLEGKVVKPETKDERGDREKDERKDMLEEKRLLTGNSQPTNPRRYEEIKHRYNSLNQPLQSAKPAPRRPPVDGSSSVAFYCWKNGELCLFKINVTGTPTIVDP